MDFKVREFLDLYGVRNSEPGLLHLRAIGAAFSNLPYENITKILKDARSSGDGMKLRLAGEVLEDHIQWKTGGTCFSLCNALSSVLEEAGYQVFFAMADMHYGANVHCAVIVSLQDQRYLLDPGYLLNDPVVLPAPGTESTLSTPMNTIVLQNEGAENFSLYTDESGERKWRYRLRALPTPVAEFRAHWIRSFSMNTMENLTLSRLGANGRLYFRKNRLDQVGPSGRTKTRVASEEFQVLSNVFGVPGDLIAQAQKTLLSRPTKIVLLS